MTATQEFICTLQDLKAGDLGHLRTRAGTALDEAVDSFDLFTSLWWPLRQRSQRAPRREVAWLIAKLYACCPLPQSDDCSLARQLGRIGAASPQQAERQRRRFDELLTLPLSQLESPLRWALRLIADDVAQLDWVRLTDELSMWERQSTREKWACEYLDIVT